LARPHHADGCARYHFAWSALSPTVTAVHATADALLFRWALLHPVYAVGGAAVLAGGWSVQFGMWIMCYQSERCGTSRIGDNLRWARFAFGVVLAALYLVYLALAAVATHRWRRQQQLQAQRV
jgi:hypothetical protein